MTSVLLLLALGGSATFAWTLWPTPTRRSVRGQRTLRQRYLSLLHEPPHLAEATLQRGLADMQQRYPGRSTAWHLRKLIADLQRDRR